MVGKWKGIMVSGFLEIPVIVNYGSSSVNVREWSGSGATNGYWPMSPLQFETNIGDVRILNQAFRADGKHHIEFKGSGNPKGPLAEAMG
jgi:hypothetical protein